MSVHFSSSMPHRAAPSTENPLKSLETLCSDEAFIISELLCPHTADLDPLHRVSKAAFKMLTKATFSSRDLTA